MKKIVNLLISCLCVGSIYSQTDTRSVRVAPAKDASVFSGTTYAVIVGVSNYKYVKPLSFADQDAILFKEFLESKAGGSVKDDNVFLIMNDDANASAQPRIRKWLTETKKIQKGDRVYFYFAGHGDAINPDEYFFLLQDCNPGGDKNNYTGGMASVIEMYSIKAFIKNNLVNNGVDVLLIWDACRTNELPGGESGLKNMQEGIAEQSSGESIMLSASAGEVALENSTYAHGHGLFTFYLIDGLSGAADNTANDGNGDGKVDMKELKRWVERKVSVDAEKKFKTEQDPRFIYRGDKGDETLSIVDSSFENDWAMKKMSENDLVLDYKNTTKSTGRNVQEADSMVVELYNKFMEAVKKDSLDEGKNSAEELYKQLLNKYPENSLTDQAGFNLAMEYINVAQDKINLYLSGKDDITILAAPKASDENHNTLNQALTISSGKNYGRNGQYLYRALALLKKDSNTADPEYTKQIQAKADFLSARSYVSNEGIVTDFSKALQLAKTAMSIQPKAAYNYLLFGSLYCINKQYDSAIYYGRKALALAPKWVNAINNIGIAFDAEKRSDSARFYYRKAIATNPDFLIPYTNLSYNFSNQQMYDSAYKYARAAVDLNPYYANGIHNLGIIFHYQKIYDSAKIYYYKAIGIDPKNASACNNLGILFYNENQNDSAKSYYYKTINRDPKYTDAYYNLAILYYDQKKYDSANNYYDKTVNIDPKYADGYIGLGIICYNHKQYDSASMYYQKALSIDSKAIYAYYNLGILSSIRKKYDSSKYYYREALSVNPKYSNAYNGLGDVFTDEKQYDSARIYYYKGLNIDQKNASSYNGLGNVFMNYMLYDSASGYYRKAISLDPKFTTAYYNAGLLFDKQDQPDSAKYYFRKSLSIDPQYTAGYNG
ncbi:MAG: tetratricopeptide repeat protein, partial [Ginsengibacter sp.]